MDLIKIEEHYKKMTDDDLIRMASNNAHGLRPEVEIIIQNEIIKRNLDLNLLEGIEAQNKLFTFEEINNYSILLRTLPCPLCGTILQKLNGTRSHIIRNLYFIKYSEYQISIACPDCLDKINNKAIKKNLLFGWWPSLTGIFYVPKYVYKNYKEKKENRIYASNKALLEFTYENIGKIVIHKENKKELQKLISEKKEF